MKEVWMLFLAWGEEEDVFGRFGWVGTFPSSSHLNMSIDQWTKHRDGGRFLRTAWVCCPNGTAPDFLERVLNSVEMHAVHESGGPAMTVDAAERGSHSEEDLTHLRPF